MLTILGGLMIYGTECPKCGEAEPYNQSYDDGLWLCKCWAPRQHKKINKELLEKIEQQLSKEKEKCGE